MVPREEPERAVTRLAHDGELLAVLVHDRSLLDKLKESRARIVAATDAERRRIEREPRRRAAAAGRAGARAALGAASLVDGGSGVRADARLGSRRATGGGGGAARARARAAPGDPDGGGPCRSARVAGDQSASARDPREAPDERLTPEVEATAYFVAREGLANVVKHAEASAATIAARRESGLLVEEVVDDGVRDARLNGGSGLRGLADRVEALGGRLTIDSPTNPGTRIEARIPCGS